MTQWPGNPHKEKTSFGNLSRSQLMSRVRSSGNQTTELLLAKLLRKSKLIGWRRHWPLIGKPDFVWPKSKLVVFVDGCFWHGHTCGKNINPKTNAKLWQEKIKRNRERDRRITRELRLLGWHVIRCWECHLSKKPNYCLTRIKKVILSNNIG